jgi:hypothetical protein
VDKWQRFEKLAQLAESAAGGLTTGSACEFTLSGAEGSPCWGANFTKAQSKDRAFVFEEDDMPCRVYILQNEVSGK